MFTVASRSPVRTGVRRGKHPPLTLLDFTPTCAGNLRSPVLGSTQGSPSLFRATNHLGVGSGSPFPGPTDRRGPASTPHGRHTALFVSTATLRGWGLVRPPEALSGEPVPAAIWFRLTPSLKQWKFFSLRRRGVFPGSGRESLFLLTGLL